LEIIGGALKFFQELLVFLKILAANILLGGKNLVVVIF
jgi:hypothetical protein